MRSMTLRTGTMTREESGILRMVYEPKGVVVDENDTKESLEAILALSDGKPALLMSIITNVASATPEANAYGRRPEFVRAIAALALVTGSLVSRVVGNFFMTVNRPPHPTRIFNDEGQARAWLLVRAPKEDQPAAAP